MISTHLHLNTTIVKCWLLTLKNKVNIGFNDHDQDIEINKITYHSNCSGVSAISQNLEGKRDLFEFKGILTHEMIQLSDIMSGLYDDAQIEIFLIDINNKENKIWSKKGFVSEIKIQGSQVFASVKSVLSFFDKNIGNFYSVNCRAHFGDQKCKINTNKFRKKFIIESTSNNRKFEINEYISNQEIYNRGKILFLSGKNIDLAIDIHSINQSQIILAAPAPFKIEAGDVIEMSAGCNKTFKMCCENYGNAENFRGEPHIPTNYEILT